MPVNDLPLHPRSFIAKSGFMLTCCFQYTPYQIKISIAAIDPTEEAVIEEGQTAPRIPRSTLKLVRFPSIVDDSDSENNLKDLIKEQLEDLKALAAAEGSDSEDGSEKEPEAGPSNSSKPKDGVKKLTNALKDTADSSDEEMADVDAVKPNGVKRHKGKSKALTEDDEEDDSDAADSDSDDEPNVTVICTLDTERVRSLSRVFFYKYLSCLVPGSVFVA